jgi:hypothetical protein
MKTINVKGSHGGEYGKSLMGFCAVQIDVSDSLPDDGSSTLF